MIRIASNLFLLVFYLNLKGCKGETQGEIMGYKTPLSLIFICYVLHQIGCRPPYIYGIL